MVKESNQRTEKFAAKISGDIRKQRYDSQKKVMVELETLASADMEKIELDVKGIVDGEPALYLPYYIIFAKEVYSKMKKFEASTLNKELTVLMNKWASRGCNFIFLREIARRYAKPALDLYNVCAVPNLVLNHTFFTGSGAKAWDLSENNNHLTGANFPTWTAGKIGRGLLFDGIDDVITTPALTGFSNPSGVTISFWFNNTAKADTNGVMNIPGKMQSEFRTFPEINLRLRTDTGDFHAITIPNTVANGTWGHFLFTYNNASGETKIYLNGVSISFAGGSYTGNVQSWTGLTFNLGREWNDGGFYFKGTLDEFMLLNRFVNPTEALRIYNTTK